MVKTIFVASISALTLAGCAAMGPPPAGPVAQTASASAELRDPAGRLMGNATLTQVGNGVRLGVQAMNLPSGAHGLHIHQVGSCLPPDFASAGSHWNPNGRMHGKDNPAGMHRGDLPNILIGTDGRGSLEYTIPATWLVGGTQPVLDSDGASIVVHAMADDYRTDPSGNSGSRIACGVFR